MVSIVHKISKIQPSQPVTNDELNPKRPSVANSHIINLDPGELPSIVDDLAELTTEENSPFFYYGGKLVTLISSNFGEALDLTDTSELTDYLMRQVKFQKKGRNGYVDTDLPTKYVAALLKRKSSHNNPAARKLRGIIHAPTLRHDGSLLSKSGYDSETQLFFDNPKGLLFPSSLPPATHEEAEKALAKLKFVLKEFNFESEVDCSVAISIMLATLIRKLLDTAPALAATGPDVNTGKSFLSDLITIYGTGQLAHPITFSGDHQEERKLLLGALMEGMPVIVFDNVDCQLRSAALSTGLTQKVFKGRLLNSNSLPKAPTDVTIIFNGINLRANKDISRRSLPCVLKTAQETFELNACRYVADNRSELVMAGLTIMASYRAAGCPGLDKLPPFPSYGDWSEWVRGPLVWLGMEDPCDRLSWWSRYDHDNHLLIRVLHELNFKFKNQEFTVASLRKAFDNKSDDLQNVYSVAPQGSSINAHKLGIWLSNKLGTVRDELMLIDVGTYQGALKYQVVSTAQPLLQEVSPPIGAGLDTTENVGKVMDTDESIAS